MPPIRSIAAAMGCAAIVLGCAGSATPTAQPSAAQTPTPSATVPSATAQPSPTPTAAPSPTAAPIPSGHLPFPSQFEIELEPGRYWSSPPFEVGFSFTVDKPGWIAGHLNAEFFDIQRDTDGGGPEWPTNILGWSLPTFVRGDRDIPVTGLTPAEAVAVLNGRLSLAPSNAVEFELYGRDAARIDLHPLVQSPVFGGPGGTFNAGPPLDARVAFVPFEDRLLVVMVQAAEGDLDARWLEALPIIESVELPE